MSRFTMASHNDILSLLDLLQQCCSLLFDSSGNEHLRTGGKSYAIIGCEEDGSIIRASTYARRLLRQYGLLIVDSGSLGPTVLQWLHSKDLRFELGSLRSVRTPLSIELRRGTLRLRSWSTTMTWSLLLEEQRHERLGLRTPGLSPRENEVLKLVSHGKSNAEIAVILGISVRTVHKHMENIFDALGVEHRHAAMAKVFQRLYEERTRKTNL